MTTCTQAQEWMQLYLDHRLSLARIRALERHMEGCKQCRAEWMLLEDVVAGVHSLGHIVEPAGLTDAVMARIAAATAQPPVETPTAFQRPKQRPLRAAPFHLAARDVILSTILATLVVLTFVLAQPTLRNAVGTQVNPAIAAGLSLFQALFSPNDGLVPFWLGWALWVALGIAITLFVAGSEIRSLWRQRIRERLPQPWR
jgi:anti-sigma factor RsiW